MVKFEGDLEIASAATGGERSTTNVHAWSHTAKEAVAAARVMAVALALAAPIAWATFSDVPGNHAFHADINAIPGAGITSACGPEVASASSGGREGGNDVQA